MWPALYSEVNNMAREVYYLAREVYNVAREVYNVAREVYNLAKELYNLARIFWPDTIPQMLTIWPGWAQILDPNMKISQN